MGYLGYKPADKPLTSADITDSIITSAKIADGTITNTDVASSIIIGQTAETSIAGGDSILIYDDSATALRKMTRTNFVAGIGGTNTPNFYAYKTGNQTINNSTETKVQFDAEYYDTGSCYDNATNYRFTPNVAGKYLLIASIGIDENTSFNRLILYIKKNDSTGLTQRRSYVYGTNEQTHLNMGIFEANGTTDFFSVHIFQDSGGTTTLFSASDYTYFQGFKLIE